MHTYEITRPKVHVTTVTEFYPWPFRDQEIECNKATQHIDSCGCLCSPDGDYLFLFDPRPKYSNISDCLLVTLNTGEQAVTSPEGLKNFDQYAYSEWIRRRDGHEYSDD